MLRFGIFRADDYRAAPAGAPRIVRMAFTSRRVSLQLLRMNVPATPAELRVFEHLVAKLRLGSGVYRTTCRKRFADMDGAVNELLARRHAPDSPLDVHDWAASDCLASSEWAASLLALFPRASFTASDRILFLVEATLPDGSIFYLDPDGAALQYVRRPFVVRLVPPDPMLMVVNRLIGWRALVRLKAMRLEIPAAWLNADDDELASSTATLRKVPLTHPEARLLAERDARFAIRSHSVFEPLDRAADVIRTMNIFNRTYFPPERLRDGVRAVWRSLNDGGCWIVGRTAEEERVRNDATILERGGGGFRVVARIGGGSEVEGLAVECAGFDDDRHG